MILKPLRTIPGLQVHYAHNNLCVGSRGLGLYGSDDYGVNWRRYGIIPSSQTERWLQLFSPYQRLLRGGVNCIIPASEQNDPVSHNTLEDASWIAMSGGTLYHVTENGQRLEPLWKLRRGRRTLHRGLSFSAPYLYVGDYWANRERQAVNLYQINVSNKEHQVFYQFPAGSVRHIHNAQIDPYTGWLWISTGDEDQECQICHFDTNTGKRTLVGEGSQKWRAVSLIFRPNAVYWGTDNPLGENQIWRYDRKSGKLENIGTVRGPVYYGKGIQEGKVETACSQELSNHGYCVFGTVVEFGNGQQDRFGRIYVVPAEQNENLLSTVPTPPNEVYRQPKDGWHKRYFGYTVFELNVGHIGHNRFWATHKGFQGGLRSTLFEVCPL